MKKIYFFISVLLVSLMYLNVNALDINKKGSAEIIIEYSEEEPIVGAGIDLYKIADLVIDDNGHVEYKYVPELSGEVFKLQDLTGLDINSTKDDEYKKSVEVAKSIDLSKLSKIDTKTTDSNGRVKFENLDLGLYLVKQTGAVKGYTNIDEFVFTVPGYDNGDWIYDIVSMPKPTIEKLVDLNITKVWNNNSNGEIPNSLTINIYNKDELFETIELTKDNNWTMTIENVPYSTYYRVEEVNIPSGYNVTYLNEDNNFTIINTNKLPQTGALTYMIPLFAFIGIGFTSLGLYFNKKN